MKIKSFDRRAELLEAAFDEFTSKSYEDASLNSIIKNAGISKGTFYYHFQDKKALYLTLIRLTVDAKMEFMERRLKDYTHNDDLSVFENLKLQARFGVEFAKDYPRYYLLGMKFRKEKGKEIYEAVMDMLDDTTESFYEDLMEKAMRRGDFRKEIPAEFAKRVMAFLLYRFDEVFEITNERYDFDKMLHDFDSLIDFIQHGLGNK